MAAKYIPVVSTEHGNALKLALKQLAQARSSLLAMQGIMTQAIDTTPDPDDYTLLETTFGLPAGQGAAAKAELDSVVSKITVDSSVTNVAAAITQAAAIFGVV